MRDGFVKVAAGTPKIRVADCRYNAEQIFTLMREAAAQGVRVLCLPELCLTGYTCGDLFLQDTLLSGAEEGLSTILEATKNLDMVTALGMPVRFNNKLYNCAAVIHKGEVQCLLPKTHLPNYGEFYEKRWFSAWEPGRFAGVRVGEVYVPITDRQIFAFDGIPDLVLGVELCEDLWAPEPPSAALARSGATLILNLSASDETVGKAGYRRSLVTGQSARLVCGYVYADAGEGESTTDLVFTGHNLIAENGTLLAERRFATGLTISEIDVARLAYERRRMTTFQLPAEQERCPSISLELEPSTTTLTRYVSPTPFVPEDAAGRAERCDEILKIAALGLKKRIEHTRAAAVVVGLSGGLDSTLAVLITAVAMRLLDRPASDIIAVTMPCFGTTDRTRDNAVELAGRLGATLKRIDISEAVKRHFKDIGQSMEDHDVTFENGQARERTQVLMDIANQVGGMVVGTGDLSELALGWATYNGDHMSMYGVNASIPKTLVRHLVSYVCGDKAESEPELSHVLADILDTPVSPELLPAVNGQISQKTEDLVGPYELHDFFLYYAIRWGFPPKKVLRLAEHAFGRTYDRATILRWEKTFYRRFFAQQFKRSCLPDGPKVGSVTLSPRGDWRMPSDAVASLWLDELEGLA
ncbi:MAG: NAD(+) synthase [Oscillospiraceae bacterium]|uniref:Glutamine-dependent NAD(+) synthetase n=1 Tax=Intestinimonas massiliensis (ex Afouda et al. 2020) TaxID=1673721 RepID=A0ABS9M4I4_9FIRM|nr:MULTISPECIES: NAD(+) synthase [Intestinimonas]MBS6283564.1 NAD(+) synthase [Oscillospiraceae bacterium]MCG4525686.1 NAD(+) synthase [Intestinimonas massiliensis (ex Afouda et al. 2020)]MCI5562710.1 NAD(+) synthase [Intestinimonas massiliensis (ex Afouda et al. 2020)]MCQ4805734.1 NAD(+) synthase [Intestinimonas massiliensis (ex Afouda et al. 2020)]MDY5339323.1 NAD(+) synthase [Intestinimonas sp.]